MSEINSSEITERNTKKEIITALRKAEAEVKAAKSGTFDPAADIAMKAQKALLDNVGEFTTEDVQTAVEAMRASLTKTLDFVSVGMVGQLAKFGEIQEAIKSQEAKLTELLGIEGEALSLVSVANAKKALTEKFDAEHAEKVAKAVSDLEAAHNEAKEARANLKTEIQQERDRIQQEREREEEEYQYNFERKKQKANDELADELSGKKKIYNAEVDAKRAALDKEADELAKRKADLEAREAKVEELEAKVAEIPARIANAEELAIANTTAQLTAEFDREKSYLTRENEQEKATLNNKIELLEKALASKDAEVAGMATKLDAAYQEIKDMAIKSVQASGDSKVAEQLQRTLDGISANKNNK
ncbi:hypothetical protein M3_0082 [Lysinibacillus phage vB_LfM_LysYB1]|nr:hypothetical protein M3_0082 [Lysinibacillus phage vB_LfM_LysYB1]WAB25409.1 hypothetical protein M5_0231 [Lysinibacillus phage vB_LfM_LysYB2]